MRLDNFLETIAKSLSGKRQGEWESRRIGQGDDKYNVREYSFGDNTKYINRKQSAKTQKIMVQEMQANIRPTIRIYLDISSNRYAGEKKAFHTLIDTMITQAEKFCISNNITLYFHLVEDEKVLNFHTSKLIPISRHIKNTSTYVSHINALIHHGAKVQQKEIFIYISDFLAINKENSISLLQLQQKHEVFAIKLQIPQLGGANYHIYTIMQDVFDYQIPLPCISLS